MYYHHLQEMAEQLILDEVIDPSQRVAAIKSLENCWQDKIAIVWMAEDVLSADPTLSDELVKEVLEDLQEFDPEIGVNWYVIDAVVSEVKAHARRRRYPG